MEFKKKKKKLTVLLDNYISQPYNFSFIIFFFKEENKKDQIR